MKLADINQDGRIDIVTGWEEGGITKLYLHPGKAAVRKLWPSVIVGVTPNVEDAVFIDMNNDGRLDVVSCGEKGAEKIFVHLAPKKQLLKRQKWKQVILPASESRMMWMYAEPLQLDGQHGQDLIAAGKHKAAIGWFEAPRRAKRWRDWTWHSISPMGWVMSILLRDVDTDGDMDIIVTDRRDNQAACRWLENPGSLAAQRQEWESHLIGGRGLEVMFMSMADVDGDGQEEAIVAERSKETIRIYKRQDEAALEWEEQIISLPSMTGRAKSVAVGDVNGDGNNDLIVSTNTLKDRKEGLIWLDGKMIRAGKDRVFQSISGIHKAKYDKVELLDIDEDGDLDILICEENFGENSEGLGVIWYENNLNQQ